MVAGTGAVAAQSTETGSGKGGWRRLLVAALLTLALVTAVTQVLAGEVIPPLLVFAVLWTATALAVRASQRGWPAIVALVLLLSYAGASFPFFRADLAHPESAATFVPALFAALSALVAAIAAVGVLRADAPPSRALPLTAAGLALAGVVWASVATAGLADDEALAGDVAVEVRDVRYPPSVELAAGGAGVFVSNRDPFRHTFRVAGTDVHEELPAATSRRFDVELAAGTYELFCDVPGHEQMTARLVVR